MADNIEALIIEVEKNRILYDLSHTDYKDVKRKGDVWSEIAAKVGFETGQMAAKRWTNIKDAYVSYMRKLKTRSGQGLAGKLTKYKWADQLQFLNDFTMARRSCTNLDAHTLLNGIENGEFLAEMSSEDMDLSLVEEASVTNIMEDTCAADDREAPVSTSTPVKPYEKKSEKRKPKESDVNTKLLEYLSSKKSKEDPKDALYLFFHSSLATVRTFSPARQLQVKRAISQIILDIEEADLVDTL